MYVKLVHPHSSETLVIKTDGEVHSEQHSFLTNDEVDAKERFDVECNIEPRRFLIWPGRCSTESIELVRIHFQQPGARQATSLRTNWNAFLCNDDGRTIDRLHKHHLPREEPAGT